MGVVLIKIQMNVSGSSRKDRDSLWFTVVSRMVTFPGWFFSRKDVSRKDVSRVVIFQDETISYD